MAISRNNNDDTLKAKGAGTESTVTPEQEREPLDAAAMRLAMFTGRQSNSSMTAISQRVLEKAKEYLAVFKEQNGKVLAKDDLFGVQVFENDFEIPMLANFRVINGVVNVITAALYVDNTEIEGSKPKLADNQIAMDNGQVRYEPAYPHNLNDESFTSAIRDCIASYMLDQGIKLNQSCSISDYGMIVYDDTHDMRHFTTMMDRVWTNLAALSKEGAPALCQRNLEASGARLSIEPTINTGSTVESQAGFPVACDIEGTLRLRWRDQQQRRNNRGRHGHVRDTLVAKAQAFVDFAYQPASRPALFQQPLTNQGDYNPAYIPHVVISNNETLGNKEAPDEDLITQLHGVSCIAPFVTRNNWLNVFEGQFGNKSRKNLGVLGLEHNPLAGGEGKQTELKIVGDHEPVKGTQIQRTMFMNNWMHKRIIISMDILLHGSQYTTQLDFVNATKAEYADTALNNITAMMDQMTNNLFSQSGNKNLFHGENARGMGAGFVPAGRYHTNQGARDTRSITHLDVVKHFKGDPVKSAIYQRVCSPGPNNYQDMEDYKALISEIVNADITWYGVYVRVTWSNTAMFNFFGALADAWNGEYFNIEGQDLLNNDVNRSAGFDLSQFEVGNVNMQYQFATRNNPQAESYQTHLSPRVYRY